jgi:hypothetical protein
MLKMQHYPLGAIKIAGKGVQGFRHTTPVEDGDTNFEGKVVYVLRVISIFSAETAAFC